MSSIIEDISEFIFVEHMPEKSDAIMIVGGSFSEQGEVAAELWKEGYAPYCIVGGGVSVKTGKFPGPKTKQDVYNGQYDTEADFFKDVLMKNGVPEVAIIEDNKSGWTRENAEMAKVVCEENNIKVEKAILICKTFHARRSLMFYKSVFPNTEFYVVTVEGYDINRDNWFKSEYGIKRVLGELKRCGEQFNEDDVLNW
ncbi:DUF218 domain-containing protein [Hathewaya proteolytica DSM 3090]|uniref:DUF218 domain-containing protein n=1 Tax=Hathewaya proteolytica DSM 3090 TaxID=1121331 RepID=A0A1M6KKG7_9CLOT|nr:YdcF family protein [Hathewaya proteolytica]SHJ59462.1 DUF218 domain-containing protein [Hathewaya proteolytica DSM 3090]